MRGRFFAGCGPGVWFYHSKNGPILVNKKNEDKIKEDMDELLETMRDMEVIVPGSCIHGNPKEMYKKARDGLFTEK